MKLISDIRMYKSNLPNIKSLSVKMERIVMKLMENHFCLGDYDHLYINFTTCPIIDKMAPANRKPDPYHPWYRYYDIEINENLYFNITQKENEFYLISKIVSLLKKYFSNDLFNEVNIQYCVDASLFLGENMLMKFKEKNHSAYKAILYLRYLDSGLYKPLLRVFNKSGKLALEKDLPEMIDLNPIGEIKLRRKSICIIPRKNIFSQNLQPISFEIPDISS